MHFSHKVYGMQQSTKKYKTKTYITISRQL